MNLDDSMARYHATDKGYWVITLHPYDLAEYHWAYSEDGEHWLICHNLPKRRVVTTATGTPKDALAAVRRADTGIRACIDHS